MSLITYLVDTHTYYCIQRKISSCVAKIGPSPVIVARRGRRLLEEHSSLISIAVFCNGTPPDTSSPHSHKSPNQSSNYWKVLAPNLSLHASGFLPTSPPRTVIITMHTLNRHPSSSPKSMGEPSLQLIIAFSNPPGTAPPPRLLAKVFPSSPYWPSYPRTVSRGFL